jgi:hypothetical protein
MEVLKSNFEHDVITRNYKCIKNTQEIYVSSLNNFNDVLTNIPMIEKDAQEEQVGNERLKEQERIGDLYDSNFRSPKDVSDDNLEHDPNK